MGNHICAFVLINVPPKSYESFCQFCEKSPAVIEHSHIVGLNNGLLKIRVSDSEELEALLRQMRKFGLSNTSVLLSTYFTQKPFPELDLSLIHIFRKSRHGHDISCQCYDKARSGGYL